VRNAEWRELKESRKSNTRGTRGPGSTGEWETGGGGQDPRAAEGPGRREGNSAVVAVWNCIPRDGNGGMQKTARGTSEEGSWEVEFFRARNVYETRAVSFPRCWRPASANSKRDRAALASRSAPPGRKYTSPHRLQTQARIPASRTRTPSLSNSWEILRGRGRAAHYVPGPRLAAPRPAEAKRK